MKPNVKLGTGCDGNLQIPDDLLDRLRESKDSTDVHEFFGVGALA